MRKLTTFTILILMILITGCKNNDKEVQPSDVEYYKYFDTVINIRVWDTKLYSESDSLWQGVEEIIINIQETFERDAPEEGYDPSELYLLNQSAGSTEPFAVTDDLYEVIKIGIGFAELTDGKLTPAIGPLVDLWDIHSVEESHSAPTQSAIDQLKPLVDYRLVQLNDEDKTVLLPLEGMVLDLGAIAKGYAADKLATYLTSKGIKHAIINLGGNIFALGNRYEKRDDNTYNWSIGVRDPQLCAQCSLGTVYLTDKTIVTSGIYERYIIDPDTQIMYHHILDPHTGYPVENTISSVTIIADSSTTADALSTSIFALGLEAGIQFIEDYPGVEAIFIEKDMTIHKTSGVDSIYNFELT